MIRGLIINPLVIAATAAIGFFAFRAMGRESHPREMIAAALVLLLSAELALIPLMLVRGATQGPVSQAALVSTGVHMLVAAGAGFAVSSAMHSSQAYMYWLCVFYWVTLVVVSVVGVKAVRTAPMETSAGRERPVGK